MTQPAAATDTFTPLGVRARAASEQLALANSAQKNMALRYIAEAVLAQQDDLIAANQADLTLARNNDLAPALVDRLALTPERIAQMVEGLQQVAQLPDPIGTISDCVQRPSGIQVGRMRVPLGVVGCIYESRPNVTIDVAALTIKSGNGAILRGGSEALQSNIALAKIIYKGLQQAGLSGDCVQVIDFTDRSVVDWLVASPQYIDVIIPRGGKSLIERISQAAKVPVIKHLDGVCHVYVDAFANLDQALRIIENAKTQRYGTCNTMETLLIDETLADHFLPQVVACLAAHNVKLYGCAQCQHAMPKVFTPAQESDWYAEYLAPELAVKLVTGLEDAIAHINHYGSHHTDAILSENYSHNWRFLRAVDSSSVIINASTRFADGFEYGLGAEVGISTDKFHARGPVGLLGLTSEKYVVFGHGEIRT